MNYVTLTQSSPAKGLNFTLPRKYLDYADYLVNFNLFCRYSCNSDILSSKDLDFEITRTKDTPFFLLKMYPKQCTATFF